MIYKEPLSPSQLASSQYNCYVASLINGLSFICLGETVLILFAVRLGCPDYIVSTLGAMAYLGYLLMPLGKIATAKVGAAKCQAVCWVARNAAALLVAGSAVVNVFGMPLVATVLLLTGAFFFYGFRAAGVVMSQPLMGNITTKEDRSRVIGINLGLFFSSCMVTLFIISILLRFKDSLSMLTGIVIFGSLSGFTASRFINRIHETESIRESARKPIWDDFRKLFRSPVLTRQLIAGFSINLGVIMLIPISMLALKRGYGVSDTQALLYALVQFGSSAVASFVYGKIDRWLGSRRTLLYAFLFLIAIGPIWMLAPTEFHPIYMLLPFVLAGATSVITLNAMTHYFLQTVPEKRQVSCSMFIWAINGAGSGVIGMILAGMLLDFSVRFNVNESLIPGYHFYFGLAFLLLVGGGWTILRLPLLPFEKFQKRRSFVKNKEEILAQSVN